MLSTLRNAWKVQDLRKKIIWTVFLIAIFRMGSYIPVPGIDTDSLKALTQSGSLVSFYDLISGGSFSRFSIFALGVVPYINASIIMQLLTVAIPKLEQLSKEGDDGRKKIQKITRYASIVIGAITAYGSYVIINNVGALKSNSPVSMFLILLTLVVGSTFLMWLGDQITVKGVGNGTSLIIFANILSSLPMTGYQIYNLSKIGKINVVEVALFIFFTLALLAGVIYLSLAERRITVQYAGKAVGNKMMKGQSTHIPLSIIGTTVIAIIFAMSVMSFPTTIAQFFPEAGWSQWITGSSYSPFNTKTWMYPVLYALLTIFFTWFYTQITFKPDEMAENMHKSSGFIPGIRPGKPTEIYLEKVLNRISMFGGCFAAIIAVVPILVANYTPFQGIQFGGTSLLILVSVSLEIMRQLESQLTMRHYQGFLK
ncbi:preprotein translocase subunit SecY [Clostridium perfringens]|uniref:Protein translocase subunit SecY n=1 Tax=Clostridium perfringens D str. JGS1721 TaxID=488537 RepID=B1V779_CLOPF|nr:preprotein translocase subunit SecY [Clostridium perfringens]EDT70329.1 preprotein translocase, SecY subunit [Clostridium perfringens D str. JGS1721]MBO3362822.1 preprotein translocase subunit SecY [Clostridium perfringens]STB44447.1 preprotein translocase subunit SecY [Clostridium perfringens]HAT4255878.1 preprotein translocase subunit SecY [Clostridium perfringens]HAT4256624.1 preprotein translocase subunit SecY [Clostridium perfringens]